MKPKPLWRARKGFTLIELLVVVVIIGILGAISIGNFQSAQDKARVASLTGNLKIISLGLETYSSDNNGHYPTSGSEFGGAGVGLLTARYLPGDKWPKSPWSRQITQANSLFADAATPPLVTAAVFALTPGMTLPAVGKKPASIIPGPGQQPLSTTYNINTYGAVVYDYDPPDTTYVLYGIGKDHNIALLAAARSNNGN
jgi:prepilin-type N-terminal cleavage/methylation domain-containing protein